MAEAHSSDAALSASPGAQAIVARLRRAIATGVYGNGERIPPERQLAQAYGAARSTVRRALQQLEGEGLVVRRVGAGTFVNYHGPFNGQTSEIADLISPLQLIETRLAVEPYMARLAALHASSRDLEVLAGSLDKLDACEGDKDAFTERDADFHLAIARSSRNPLILHIYEEINLVRSRAQWDAMKEKILTPRQIAAYNRQHRSILEALAARDGLRVSELIVEHLEKARADLVGAHSA